MKNHNNNNGGMQNEQAMNQGMANGGVNQNQNFGGMQNPYYNNNAFQGSNQNPYYNNQGGQGFGGFGQNGSNLGLSNNNNSHNPYYIMNANQVPHSHTISSWLGQTSSDRFIRGLVIGAAATYILTNEKAQKAIIKTGMKLYGAVAGGVEEIKEKIMDAKSEIEDGTCDECEDKAQ